MCDRNFGRFLLYYNQKLNNHGTIFMRKIILATTFFATTVAFADVTIINMPSDNESNNPSTAPCASSASAYSRQACKAMMEAKKMRENPTAINQPHRLLLPCLPGNRHYNHLK